jgi:hypothetical protein
MKFVITTMLFLTLNSVAMADSYLCSVDNLSRVASIRTTSRVTTVIVNNDNQFLSPIFTIGSGTGALVRYSLNTIDATSHGRISIVKMTNDYINERDPVAFSVGDSVGLDDYKQGISILCVKQ